MLFCRTSGLVGYDVCLTRRRSPVRFRVDVLFYSGTIVLWVVKFEDNTCERPSGAMDSALDFGSSGCRFESCLGRYVPVAQLDKASDYESGDCRFESCRECIFL